MLRKVIFLFLVFFGTYSLSAQSVKPSVSIEANDVLIGDQLKTILRVESKQGENIEFPKVSEYWKGNNIEILNISNIEKNNANEGKQILSQNITIVFWDTGSYSLPALPFTYIDGKDSKSALSEIVSVKVRYPDGITGDSTYLAPIKPILEEKKTFWDFILDYQHFFYYTLGILLFLILIYLIIQSIRKNKLLKSIVTPEAKALDSLNKLIEADYTGKGLYALYHEGVSDIVRTYLNEKFGLRALESITAEILTEVQELELSTELKRDLKELLETADLVKYAKASPLPAANKFAEVFIKKLIESVLNAEIEKNQK